MSSFSSSTGGSLAIARHDSSTSLLNGQYSKSTRLQVDDLSIEDAMARLEIEKRLKEGAENLLQVLDTRTREGVKETRGVRRAQVMDELNQTNARIAVLVVRIEELTSDTSKGFRRIASDESSRQRPKLASVNIRPQTADDSSGWSIGQIVTNMSKAGAEPAYYITQINQFCRLLKEHSSLLIDLPQNELNWHIAKFCSAPHTNIVAAGYRMARYIASSGAILETLLFMGIERCLIKTLSKDHQCNIEREQAIKFIRHVYLISGADLVSKAVMASLIALAESEDRLAHVALETIAEILLLSKGDVPKQTALRCLLNGLIDGHPALCAELVMVVVQALETLESRTQLKPINDLGVIFHPFTDYVQDQKALLNRDHLLSCTSVVAKLLTSWTGLLATSIDNSAGIRSIIEALRVPRSAIRGTILDFLFDALGITMSNLASSFLAGRRLTTLGRIPISMETEKTRVEHRAYSLTKQLAALKLVLFLDAGLLDALMMVIENELEIDTMRKATLLLGEILHQANTLLPISHCRHLQTLPRLFRNAAKLDHGERISATSALYQIESLNRTRNKAAMARIASSTENQKRGKRQVEQVKIKMGLQIDDSHFRNLLLDTQVLSTKNYTKWHWDTLTELVQGPLLNPKRLEESIRATKFMKRLLAFYRPFTHRFSAIKNTKPNQKYIKFGSLLLNTLLANSDGVKYLSESKLLRQLSECLAQMDPMNHVTASDALFSRERLEETLCHGYFELLGTLSAHPLGVAMIERWRMFSSLYHLTELRSRADLVTLFLQHLDYSTEGHARIILGKALMTGVRDIRLFATQHLGTLFDADESETHVVAEWAIKLLVTQLYDISTEVCECAVKVLVVACDTTGYLEYIVNVRPSLDHLGEVGAPLLMKFLATSIGFHYLKDLDYIDREIDDWFHGRNDDYVIQIEAHLLDAKQKDLAMPVHFYGELAKTAEGVDLLLQKGHLDVYVKLIKNHQLEESQYSHQVKAALWAIGSITATVRGAPWLKQASVIKHIINIAESSSTASLKGTAYYVLGMLSCTQIGIDLLREFGWTGVTTNMGNPIGICLPDDIKPLLKLEPWQGQAISESATTENRCDPLTSEILDGVSNLSNHIVANEAAKTLIRLRKKYPSKFESLPLYDQVHNMLAKYRYRLPVRRFILDLFPSDLLIAHLHRRHQTRPSRGYSLPKRFEADDPTIHTRPTSARNSMEETPELESTPRPARTRSHRAATLVM